MIKLIYISFISAIIRLTCVVCTLLCAFTLNAQRREDTLKTEDVIIIKEYQPTISDAFKLSENPKVDATTPPVPKLKYSVLPKQIKTIFNIAPIMPAKMKGEPLTKFYKSYIKLGVGNYTTTYAEAFVNNLRSRHHSIGAHLKHFASSGTIKDAGFSGFSDNEIHLYGKKFLRKYAVKGGVNFNRNVIYYYGYNPSDYSFLDNREAQKDNTKQRYATIESYAQLKSYFKDSTKLNHDIKLKYYHLEDMYKTTMENNILINADFNKFFNKERLIISSSFDFNRINNANEVINNGILKLHPQIISRGAQWRINVGLGLFADVTNTAYFHFYPIADFKYNVVSDMLVPYAGVTGKIKRNNFRSYTNENPFMISSTPLRNSNYKVEIYGGVRGTFSSTAAFNLRVSKSRIIDMPFFVNDTNGFADNKFTVVYDTVSVIHFSNEVSYQKTDKLKLILRSNYYIYDMTFEKTAWHIPKYQYTLSGNYDLKDKIIAKADIFLLSGQTAKSYDSKDGENLGDGIYKKKLKGIIDVNIGLEYRYTKKFSAYINFNNIGGIKYYRWNNYPTLRFNVLGGITYGF